VSLPLAGAPRRGRPPKFGRPSQLVTLTLPNDVVDWLKTVHPDAAWAVVKLHEQSNRRVRRAVALAELVPLPQRRALIMVNTEVLRQLPGAAIIPLSDGRGILALEAGKGVADLELAVIDRLDDRAVAPAEREALQALRDRLRDWRRQGVRFESRAIIVAHRMGAPEPVAAAGSPRRSRASEHRGE